MTTKATRDVLDVNVRPIIDGIRVSGDCGSDFAIDGVPIGLNQACDARFLNLTVDSGLQMTGDLDMNGSRIINGGAPINGTDYATKSYVDAATGTAEIGNDFIPAGTMVPWPSLIPPSGWLICDGSTVGKPGSGAVYEDAGYENLFDTIKGMQPNTGFEDFATGDTVVLPDMTGRIPAGFDSVASITPGLNAIGATTGDYEIQLTEAQLALHTHVGSTNSTSAASGSTTGTGAHEHSSHGASVCYQGSGDNNVQGCGSSSTWGGGHHSHGFDLPAHSHGVDVAGSGSDEPHPNVQPSIAFQWIIKAIPGVIDQDVLLADGSVPMNSGASLVFSGGGQVLGLPSIPSGLSAACSKDYTDTEITAAVAAYAATASATFVPLGGGGVMTGNLNMAGQRLVNVPTTPAALTDAVNSQHVIDEVKTGVSGTVSPGVTSGAVAHLGAASVLIASGPGALVPSGGGGYPFFDVNLAANNAVMAIVYVKVWDTTPPPSTQISLVFEPGIFPTEMWVPRMDGVNLPTGDILAQQFFVPIPPGGTLIWDVSAPGLDGDIWLVGFVKSIP